MQEKKGLSGSTLKMIAIITMFIDHIGAVIVERMLLIGKKADDSIGCSLLKIHCCHYLV